MPPLIALVDCNSFYVSCECVFRPDLWDKPVGVLSNNDGCFIARNQALKSLGVKMGVPLFQVADLVKMHQVQLFSSNFPLYADMSARVMSILEEFAPTMEVYSIDEAFLDLTGVCQDGPDCLWAKDQANGAPCHRHSGLRWLGADQDLGQARQLCCQKVAEDRRCAGLVRPHPPRKADADRAGGGGVGYWCQNRRQA